MEVVLELLIKIPKIVPHSDQVDEEGYLPSPNVFMHLGSVKTPVWRSQMTNCAVRLTNINR